MSVGDLTDDMAGFFLYFVGDLLRVSVRTALAF